MVTNIKYEYSPFSDISYIKDKKHLKYFVSVSYIYFTFVFFKVMISNLKYGSA